MRQLSVFFKRLLVLSGLLFAVAVYAQVDVFEFETAEQETRFRQLANEFRCPMCQNANLTHSTGGVAADLRREIYNQILEGRSDAEIEQFMLQRYGDFILYRPRLTVKTILLWFGPALFFIIGLWVAFGIIKRSANPQRADTESRSSETPPAEDLTADEQARLDRLLSDKLANNPSTGDSSPDDSRR